MLTINKIKNGSSLVALQIFITLLISGCDRYNPVDAYAILSQLPDNDRLILVPPELANDINEEYKVISFDSIVQMQETDSIKYFEVEFYQYARSLDVQYIIISSKMTNSTNPDFPWMTNKNFRVCPGTVDHKNSRYYTLLVWDNAKDTYHFFKFLYEDKK